jgi:hypothetical protein
MSVLVELESALQTCDSLRFDQQLCAQFPQDHNLAWARGIGQWLTGNAASIPAFQPGPAPLRGSAQREALCAAHAEALLRQRGRRPAPPPQAARRIVADDYDCLGDRFAPNSWGIAMVLNALMMRQISPTRRVAAVVTMRDDGLSLLEWIAQYRVLGFERIFVFANDCDDRSDELLDELNRLGIVTFIEQKTQLVVSPQMRAFEYTLHFLEELRDYKWVVYLDSDELLILEDSYRHSIMAFLDDVERSLHGATADAVLFQWRWQVSAKQFAWAPELLLKRFQHARMAEHCKALVRLTGVMSMRQVHFPETIGPALLLDADLQPIGPGHTGLSNTLVSRSVLAHYWNKSFEEFVLKKRRGDTITGETKRAYRRDMALFFEWNGPETDDNATPAPADLVAAIEQELVYLRSLADVASREQMCRDCARTLIDSYMNTGALRLYYEDLLSNLPGKRVNDGSPTKTGNRDGLVVT